MKNSLLEVLEDKKDIIDYSFNCENVDFNNIDNVNFKNCNFSNINFSNMHF